VQWGEQVVKPMFVADQSANISGRARAFCILQMAPRWMKETFMAPPEDSDVQRNQMEPVPPPSPDEGEGNEIRVSHWQFGAKSPERSER
jgi:hypothetical protein